MTPATMDIMAGVRQRERYQLAKLDYAQNRLQLEARMRAARLFTNGRPETSISAEIPRVLIHVGSFPPLSLASTADQTFWAVNRQLVEQLQAESNTPGFMDMIMEERTDPLLYAYLGRLFNEVVGNQTFSSPQAAAARLATAVKSELRDLVAKGWVKRAVFLADGQVPPWMIDVPKLADDPNDPPDAGRIG